MSRLLSWTGSPGSASEGGVAHALYTQLPTRCHCRPGPTKPSQGCKGCVLALSSLFSCPLCRCGGVVVHTWQSLGLTLFLGIARRSKETNSRKFLFSVTACDLTLILLACQDCRYPIHNMMREAPRKGQTLHVIFALRPLRQDCHVGEDGVMFCGSLRC